MINIIAVGKKHEDWVLSGIERYQKRLKQPWDINWMLLPHSSFDATKARDSESEAILSKLKPSDYVILLDERGKSLDSPALSDLLNKQFTNSQRVVVIIGGAYGVNDKLRDQAQFVLSLSDLVFPHQLVRLILTEQIYRSQELSNGHPYHHV